MDAIDRYIERLNDPAVRSFKRMMNHVDEGELEQVDRTRTSEGHIVAAEKELGMMLPPSYRKLVTTTDPRDKEYGLYWVWVDGLDTFSEDIVSVNQRFHGDYAPPFLIAVFGTDEGDEYCFDTRYPDERGEYPIVLWDQRTCGTETTEFETQSRDLGEFLLASLGGKSPP
jgi:cell wall assembly regulator SMI1